MKEKKLPFVILSFCPKSPKWNIRKAPKNNKGQSDKMRKKKNFDTEDGPRLDRKCPYKIPKGEKNEKNQKKCQKNLQKWQNCGHICRSKAVYK